MAEEKETTTVDPIQEKQETTAVESEEVLVAVGLEPVDKGPTCPMTFNKGLKRMDECLASDCAWWVEGQGQDREAGCSIRVLAEACSAFMTKVRKGKVFGR